MNRLGERGGGLGRAVFGVLLLLPLALQIAEAADGMPQFVDVAAEAGIGHRNRSGGGDKHYIIETQSAGVGVWDYDMDGHADLFFTDGDTLSARPRESAESVRGNRLYRNRGDGTFENATRRAGLGRSGWNMGCAMADYDNDGDVDLYVSRWGSNALYRNEGDGTFLDVAVQAGSDDAGWGIGCAFADYDSDGDIDLYVANYVHFVAHGPPFFDRWCTHNGIRAACGPAGILSDADVLYRNDGQGRFVDVASEVGVGVNPPRPGMGAAWGDLDGDGDLDLYVANDGFPNSQFRNDGSAGFTDVALVAGTAYSGTGKAQAGMGVALGDYDNDERLDILVTNFSQDYNTLYRNEGGGFFADVSGRAGLAGPSRAYMGWGTFFFDFDCDGYQDLFVANGHLMPAIDEAGVGLHYAQQNQLFRNTGQGAFADVSATTGPGLNLARVSRGAAYVDYDNDGDLDIAVANLDAMPTLLRNDGGNRSGWLSIRLRGGIGASGATGARVVVETGDGRRQIREVTRGSSFQAQNDDRLHFGVADNVSVRHVEVRWPGGATEHFARNLPLPLDSLLTLEEGGGP